MNEEERSVRLVKLTLLTHRKEGLSEAELEDHLTNRHAPLAKEWLVKHGILRYTHYFTPSSTRSQLQYQLSSLGFDPASVADYDMYAEFWMPSLERFVNALRDPYYLDVLAPDEANFADHNRSKMTLGWENCWIKDGKIVGDVPNFINGRKPLDQE